MAFSSVPAYLDQQNAWNQQPQLDNINHHPPTIPIPEVQLYPHNHQFLDSTIMATPPISSSAIRPPSMPDRARLAKLPQPEHGLKCPRCDSSNTKFCYFNNYSLSQPRHFCKTCKRYWTRGGALRSIPVGGGFRRNKRNRSTSSKMAGNTSSASATSNSSSSSIATGVGVNASIMQPQAHQMPLASSFQPLGEFSGPDLGLGFPAIHHRTVEHHHYDPHHWRFLQFPQQFPSFLGLEAAAEHVTYANYEHVDQEGSEQVMQNVCSASSSGLITQMASVKVEDSNNTGDKNDDNNVEGISLARSQYLGLQGNNDQYWGGASGNNSTTSGCGWNNNNIPSFGNS